MIYCQEHNATTFHAKIRRISKNNYKTLKQCSSKNKKFVLALFIDNKTDFKAIMLSQNTHQPMQHWIEKKLFRIIKMRGNG